MYFCTKKYRKYALKIIKYTFLDKKQKHQNMHNKIYFNIT